MEEQQGTNYKFLLDLKSEIDKTNSQDDLLHTFEGEKKNLENQIKQKCSDNYVLVTGKLNEQKNLNGKNTDFIEKLSEMEESVENYMMRNIYAINTKKNQFIMTDNFKDTMSAVKSCKFLFQMLKNIDHFLTLGNFFTAKNLQLHITDSRFDVAFKIPLVQEHFTQIKNKMVLQIRENLNATISVFVKYTDERERNFTKNFITCCNNYIKSTDNDDYINKATEQVIKNSINMIENINQSSIQNEKQNESKLNYVNQFFGARLFAVNKSSNNNVSKVVNNKSVYAASANQLYIPRVHKALYEMRSDHGILDSCLMICKDSNNELKMILQTLKKDRRQQFLDELSWTGKKLNDIKKDAGYILAFLLNEKSLEDKLKKYDYKNIEGLWNESFPLFQCKIKRFCEREDSKTIIALRNVLHFFSLLFKKFGLSVQQASFSDEISRNFIIFCKKLREPLVKEIKEIAYESIKKPVPISSINDYIDKVEKYGFKINDINSDLLIILGVDLPKDLEAKYSEFFIIVAEKFTIQIKDSCKMAKGSIDMESNLPKEIEDSMKDIIEILEVMTATMNWEICNVARIIQDLEYILNLSSYFSDLIESEQNYNFKVNINYKWAVEQLTMQLEDMVNKYFPLKLKYFIDGWKLEKEKTWSTKEKIKQAEPTSNLQKMSVWLSETLLGVRESRESLYISLSYLSFNLIANTINSFVFDEIKEFNIFDMYNLKLDIEFLIRYAQRDLQGMVDIINVLLKSYQQTILFISGDVSSYISNRAAYDKLDEETMWYTLQKFQKVEKNLMGLPLVRKRECLAVCKTFNKKYSKKKPKTPKSS